MKNADSDAVFPFFPLSDLDMEKLSFHESTETFPLHMPDEYQFLHEAAAIEFHGTVFAAWYNNREKELQDETVIRGRRSADGGKTWSDAELIAKDPEGKLLYCPPVFGICDDQLYLLINTMVSADHMHSLDLYSFDENDQKFHFRRRSPIPFNRNSPQSRRIPRSACFAGMMNARFLCCTVRMISESIGADRFSTIFHSSTQKSIPERFPMGEIMQSATSSAPAGTPPGTVTTLQSFFPNLTQ